MAQGFWNEKVVVITGASGGIGAALAEEVDRRGASVVLAARREAKLKEVAAKLRGPNERVVADVTRRPDVRRVFDAAVEKFGRVDVWVNNAGRGITRKFEEIGDEDLDAMIRDNVKSALYGMQAVLPHFRARRQGALVNVSSMLGRVPFVGVRAAYSASKAALSSLTESLRLELARECPEIQVSQVLPGVVFTDFGLNALGGGQDSRAMPGGQPAEEVARAIADGVEERRADIYTRPDAIERVIDHLRALGGPRPAK